MLNGKFSPQSPIFHFSDLNKPVDCSTKLPFICEKYNVSSLEKYSPDSGAKIQCSGDWIAFQNKVRRELLHCANSDCFHDDYMGCGRKASHQITSFRYTLHVTISHLSVYIFRNQVNSQVHYAYRPFRVPCSIALLLTSKLLKLIFQWIVVHWIVRKLTYFLVDKFSPLRKTPKQHLPIILDQHFSQTTFLGTYTYANKMLIIDLASKAGFKIK